MKRTKIQLCYIVDKNCVYAAQ